MLRKPHTRAMRMVSSTLIAAFVSTSLPSAAAEPEPVAAPSTLLASEDSAASLSRPFAALVASAEPLDLPFPALMAAASPAAPPAPAAPPKVPVNRQAPKVKPVPLQPVFSSVPTDEEILKARIFEEPLVPVGETTPEANRALADAIGAYVAAADKLDVTPFEALLSGDDTTPWRASLRLNLGLAYVRAGRFTRAIACWEESWRLTKDLEEAFPRAVGDRSLGELANIRMLFAQVTETELLLRQAEGRQLRGIGANRLGDARYRLEMRSEHPQLIHPTGALALQRILSNRSPEAQPDPRLDAFHSPQYGSTLAEIEALSSDVGLDLKKAYHADKTAPVPVPSVVHFNQGHYAALVARNEAGTRYLLDDVTFGAPIWISREALLEEASGYYLVGQLPEGWTPASEADGKRILGRCEGGAPPPATTDKQPCVGTNCCPARSPGMATYRFQSASINLNITDTPMGYAAARGPSVGFTLTYNHREATQPQIFTYSNLGQRWTFGQLSYIEDDNLGAVVLHVRGGGAEIFASPGGARSAPDYLSHRTVERTSANPVVWQVREPDGSVDVYSQPDCSVCVGRRVFLTQSRDPQGLTVSYTYDTDLRLVAITDATGLVTTLSYENSADRWKVTKVTDPFGRFARFDYDATGRLIRITDVIGLTSEFAYASTALDSPDFITALTTPYGTTTFRAQDAVGGKYRALEATDPLGGTERIVYDKDEAYTPPSQQIAATDPPELVPTGFSQYNVSLDEGLTHYWSKRAMALYPNDYTKAKVIRWLRNAADLYISSAKQSEKDPLENRVWYGYDGITLAGVNLGGLSRGASAQPTAIGRVLDDGTSQISRYTYNAQGKVTRQSDPSGRTTVYEYDATGMDLLAVKQIHGQNLDVLGSYTYNAAHQILTSTDAAGQTTTYTYRPDGQIATVTSPASAAAPQGVTTTYTYNGDNRLSSVSTNGVATSYEYDGYGRLWRVTDAEGYAVVTEYDALDRPTKTTYPDGTYEETVYDKLDAARRRDRAGRWTETTYDALRNPISTKDPEGRTTQKNDWVSCPSGCGGGQKMSRLVDANGNATMWDYDLQGRVVTETRANGALYTYTYETTTSRLKSVRDPNQNVKTYTYNRDNTLAAITYQPGPGIAATPNVGFVYDLAYNRVKSMTDGTGTTNYAYYPSDAPALGAGKLRSVDGPFDNDTISYEYDTLGRVVAREIGSSSNRQTQAFDAMGRLTTLTNPLGPFSYAYEGNTGRPASLTYPNGMQVTWAYYGNAGEHRLQEIHNKRPGGATLSKFNYTYDVLGNILTWRQQADSDPAKVYEFGYDKTDQLTAAILKSTDPTPQILRRQYWSYDPAGNRLAEQTDDAVRSWTHNNMNQLATEQAGGALLFKGTVNEPATVAVAGKPATVAADNRFTGPAVVPGGTGQVQVSATDSSGNTRTNTYQVTQATGTKAFTFDPNGNMTSDGQKTYEWDAENRLVAVKQGGATLASYAYNEDGIRTSKTADGIAARYMLEGSRVVEERVGTTTTRHYQGPGMDNVLASQDSHGVATYLTRDHLGSVREYVVTDGAITARRDYDPWGNLTMGAGAAGWAFTGRENEPEVGLQYYRARYYDPTAGRFISEDPIGFDGGENFYAFVDGNPVNLVDPSGLQAAAPVYDPGPWNGSARKTNNCYSYACNRKEPPGPDYKRQPGERSGRPIGRTSKCREVKAAARSEGMKNPSAPGTSCPCGYHRVRLYYATDYYGDGSGRYDYHWYRQDSNGRYSSKHGWAPVGPQVDPDQDAAATGYDVFCGTLCAPN